MRLIDANVLLKIMRNNSKYLNCNFNGLSIEEIEKFIKDAPVIDAIPKETLLDCTIRDLRKWLKE